MMSKYSTTLVIGDAHSDPKFNNDRFSALGRFIVDRQPDTVVNIGDFLTLDSLSEHTYGRPLLREGMRLADDILHGKDSYDRMVRQLHAYNNFQTRHKKKQYIPELVWLNGNHEDRGYRYVVRQPELEGFFNTRDFLDVKKDGWKVIKYKDYWEKQGVMFTHIPMQRRQNMPMGGENVTRTAAAVHSSTIVFGHTHRFNIMDYKPYHGKLTHGINVGWFGDYIPDYVEGNDAGCDWWAGLVILTHSSHGAVDVETISIDRIKQEYL